MAIVDFLYHGEANVFQENLDSFLVIAEELQLKGLMGQTNDDIVEEEKITEEEPKTTNFPKKCQKCQAVFNDRENWTKHVRLHPNPKNASMIKLPERDSEGLLHCFDCNKKVKCHSNFRRHVQKNHLKIDYKCYQCDFQHLDVYVMSRHRKTHRVDETI